MIKSISFTICYFNHVLFWAALIIGCFRLLLESVHHNFIFSNSSFLKVILFFLELSLLCQILEVLSFFCLFTCIHTVLLDTKILFNQVLSI